MISKIQFITQPDSEGNHIPSVKKACEAGVNWIQLRMKAGNRSFKKAQALEAKSICRAYNTTLIINDDAALATAIDADGVHLGQKDMDIGDARKLVGTKLIGATANTMQHIEVAVQKGADYIGLGPFRFTETKKELSPVLGLRGYQQLMEQCRKNNINLPIIGIGGILLSDIKDLISSGLYGVAVSSLLHKAEDATVLIKQMKESMKVLNNPIG